MSDARVPARPLTPAGVVRATCRLAAVPHVAEIRLHLAGDVWSSRPLAERVLGLIERARARGASVLVGDIGRAFLPRDRFRVVEARDIPVIAELEDASVKRTMVWTPAW